MRAAKALGKTAPKGSLVSGPWLLDDAIRSKTTSTCTSEIAQTSAILHRESFNEIGYHRNDK